MATVVQLGDALLSDLTDALTGKSHLCANLLQSALLATNTEALLDNLQLALFQHVTQYIVEVGGQ